MPAALDWRAQRPAAAAAARRRAGRASSGIEPGPELGRLLAELQEAAYAGEVDDRDEAVELARRLRQNRRLVIVDCAIYEDGSRRDGKVELEHAYDERHEAGQVRLDRPLRADARRSSTRSSASSTCTRWRSRTPSTRTSGRSSRSTATWSSWC